MSDTPEVNVLISEVTLLSTCLIHSLDKLLDTQKEGRPIARQKLKQSAKQFLEELTKAVNSQPAFYAQEVVHHLDANVKLLDRYAEVYSAHDVTKIGQMLEYYDTLT